MDLDHRSQAAAAKPPFVRFQQTATSPIRKGGALVINRRGCQRLQRRSKVIDDEDHEVRLFHWPFQANSTLLVQGWGFWLAIVGLFISLIGFWFTLVQLTRTKDATAAVANEVKRIGFAVSKYDATVETSRAEVALQAARKYIKENEWLQAGDALETLAKALHTVRELKVPELSTHSGSIDNVMEHANRLCERLDRVGATGIPDPEKIKTLATLREHDRLATSLRIALQRSNIGE